MNKTGIRLLLAFIFTLVVQPGYAQNEDWEECYDTLLQGQQDSTSYILSADEIPGIQNISDNVLEAATVSLIVEEIGRRAQCEPDVLKFSLPDCRTPYPQRTEVNVCLVESRAGYFLVSQDYLNTYHAIFVRWD